MTAEELFALPDGERRELVQALDWLHAGVRLVWVVDPGSRTATVHREGGQGLLLTGDAELDGEDVLPGFRLPLPDLFA